MPDRLIRGSAPHGWAEASGRVNVDGDVVLDLEADRGRAITIIVSPSGRRNAALVRTPAGDISYGDFSAISSSEAVDVARAFAECLLAGALSELPHLSAPLEHAPALTPMSIDQLLAPEVVLGGAPFSGHALREINETADQCSLIFHATDSTAPVSIKLLEGMAGFPIGERMSLMVDWDEEQGAFLSPETARLVSHLSRLLRNRGADLRLERNPAPPAENASAGEAAEGDVGQSAAALHTEIVAMATGFWISQAVYVAARLGIADLLAAGPRDADAVAAATGMHAPTVRRFLRTLCGLNVLTEDDDGRFALTPLGATLQSGTPEGTRSTILALTGEWMWKSCEQLLYSIETGKPAFPKVWGMKLFEYVASLGDRAADVGAAMAGIHCDEPPAVAAAYDFSGARSVVDVGGCTGALLTVILTAWPQPDGVLYDRPHFIAQARARFAQAGLAHRCVAMAGDFFEAVPPGGDVYILSHVAHDWADEPCLQILRNCRRAMGSTGRLLIIESVLPEHGGCAAKVMDLQLLNLTEGGARTEADFRQLLARAGFDLTRIIPTESASDIVEATAR